MEDDDEKLEQYLRGELSPEASARFKERIEQDAALAQAVADRRLAQLALRKTVRKEVRAKAAAALAAHQKRKPTLSVVPRYLIAAGIASILALGAWYFTPATAASANELFADNFTMPTAPALRSASTPQDSSWQVVLRLYRGEDFMALEPPITLLLQDSSFQRKDQARFLLGASYLAEENAKAAISLLQEVTSNSSLHQDAEWYLALAFLAAENTEAAQDQLAIIVADPRHYKYAEALAMLEALR